MIEFTGYSRIRDTAATLREIITIVMGIAFTTAIVMFLTQGVFPDGTGGHPIPLGTFQMESVLAFIAVLTAIVRFFHGNVNYLSSVYSVIDAVAINRKYQYRLAVDFLFIFVQAMLFCGLAVYQVRPYDFYRIFTLLFFVDGVWFLIVYAFKRLQFRPGGLTSDDVAPDRRQPDEPKVVFWIVGNLATGTLMLLLVPGVMSPTGLCTEQGSLDCQHLLFALIAVNTVADYWLNHDLYFPSYNLKRGDSVFVAARFTTAIGPGATFDPDLRAKIELVHRVLSERGLHVLSSHTSEEFGEKVPNPERFVQRDLDDIGQSRLFILLLDPTISAGAFTELGWAACLGKPVVILIPTVPASFSHTVPIVDGLRKSCRYCKVYHYRTMHELEKRIDTALQGVSSWVSKSLQGKKH